MIVLLIGCVKMNMTIDVKSAEEIDLGIEYIFNETLFSQYGDYSFSLKDMEKELQEQAKKQLPETKAINKEIDGQKRTGIEISTNITGKDVKAFLKSEGDKIILDLPSLTKGMTDSSDVTDTGTSKEGLKSSNMEMNIIVNMPSTPTSTYGKVEGKTVTIDLLQMMSDKYVGDIVITATQSSSSMISIIGGVVVVAIFEVVFVLKKNESVVDTEQEEI